MSLVDTVPEEVSRIEPIRVDFPMVGYCQKDILSPTEDAQRDFFADSWKKWADLPNDRQRFYERIPPSVFRFDLSGVGGFDPVRLMDGFACVLTNFKGQKGAFAFYDQITPWRSFGEAVEIPNRARLIVIARELGIDEYDLLGDVNKVISYQNIMDEVTGVNGWISNVEFTRRNPTLPKTILDHIHQDGLLLKATSGQRTFYRSIV